MSKVINYLLCYFQTFKNSETIFFVWKLPVSEGGSKSKQIQSLDSDKVLCEAGQIRTQLTKCPQQTWPTWLESVSKLPKQCNIFHFFLSSKV